MFRGYIAAVVTPFRDGRIDLSSFEVYIDRLINSGISGIVVCGSTGESLSLSLAEKIELIRVASALARGEIKVIAGVIDSSTASCIELMKSVEDIVDAFLCICPFYVKPSQNQVVEHFRALDSSTSRHIILYNNPGRVGISIGFEAFRRICELKNVAGIKECTSDLSVFSLWRSAARKDFAFLTGNDDSVCAAMAMGAVGAISVTANVVPELCVSLYKDFCEGNSENFCKLRDALAPLHELMFAEPSPGPVKYALSQMGLMHNELRMPLSPIGAALREKIDNLLGKLESI